MALTKKDYRRKLVKEKMIQVNLSSLLEFKSSESHRKWLRFRVLNANSRLPQYTKQIGVFVQYLLDVHRGDIDIAKAIESIAFLNDEIPIFEYEKAVSILSMVWKYGNYLEETKLKYGFDYSEGDFMNPPDVIVISNC